MPFLAGNRLRETHFVTQPVGFGVAGVGPKGRRAYNAGNAIVGIAPHFTAEPAVEVRAERSLIWKSRRHIP